MYFFFRFFFFVAPIINLFFSVRFVALVPRRIYLRVRPANVYYAFRKTRNDKKYIIVAVFYRAIIIIPTAAGYQTTNTRVRPHYTRRYAGIFFLPSRKPAVPIDFTTSRGRGTRSPFSRFPISKLRLPKRVTASSIDRFQFIRFNTPNTAFKYPTTSRIVVPHGRRRWTGQIAMISRTRGTEIPGRVNRRALFAEQFAVRLTERVLVSYLFTVERNEYWCKGKRRSSVDTTERD